MLAEIAAIEPRGLDLTLPVTRSPQLRSPTKGMYLGPTITGSHEYLSRLLEIGIRLTDTAGLRHGALAYIFLSLVLPGNFTLRQYVPCESPAHTGWALLSVCDPSEKMFPLPWSSNYSALHLDHGSLLSLSLDERCGITHRSCFIPSPTPSRPAMLQRLMEQKWQRSSKGGNSENWRGT